ncbi:MAG: O-antigen ligase family protein [Pseudanabaenaceae cyanobacterium]
MGTGGLLIGMGSIIYALFSLLPSSATQMLSYPWVLIWQAGLFSLACAYVLKLWQNRHPFYLLGRGLDWTVVLLGITLAGSAITARFQGYALDYSIVAFGFLTCAYVVKNWWMHRQEAGRDGWGLLYFQGYLSVILAIESFLLWFFYTYLPRLQKINELKSWGITETFDLGNIWNRNGEPFGHPNYTAGYLLLSLPLLVSLSIITKGKQRWVWVIGILISLIDLYTTSSRGGFLGLLVWIISGSIGLLWRGSLNRLWIGIGSGLALSLAAGLIAINSRLRDVAIALVSNPAEGELLYRLVTSYAGWQMGLDHWLTGAGLGAGFLMYQRYRPIWAGDEAEMLFQLHSTPVQIWAELGLLGIITSVVGILSLIFLFSKLHQSASWRESGSDRTVSYGLFSGLLAYGVLALTDYQLDVLAISGFLVIILGTISFIAEKHLPSQPIPDKTRLLVSLFSTVLLLAGVGWLIPVNIAWQNASLGVIHLGSLYADLEEQKIESAQENLEKFRSRFTTAHQFAPWHNFYMYQLGWNLVNIAKQSPPTIGDRAQLAKEGIGWLEKSITNNPYYEFPYTNVGAIYMQLQQYDKAIPLLEQAIKLAPHKRSLNFMLGFSIIQDWIQKQQSQVINFSDPQVQRAIEAIAKEIINEPILITSPLWNSQFWQTLLLNAVLPKIESISQQSPKPEIKMTIGVLRWWYGDPNAPTLLRATGNPTASLIADLSEQKLQSTTLTNNNSIAGLVLNAYYQPQQRIELLSQAYIISNRQAINPASQRLLEIMAQSMSNFANPLDWIRQKLPSNSPLVLKYRRGAGPVFNVIHRNMHGAIISDFYEFQESAIASWFFSDLFQSAKLYF